MTKGKLKSGDAMFVVRVEHYVTLSVFATALTDKYYCEGSIFNSRLTKKQAEEILKRGLFFNGNRGVFKDGYFESSFEEGDRYETIYTAAIEWLNKKYPWFNQDEN